MIVVRNRSITITTTTTTTTTTVSRSRISSRYYCCYRSLEEGQVYKKKLISGIQPVFLLCSVVVVSVILLIVSLSSSLEQQQQQQQQVIPVVSAWVTSTSTSLYTTLLTRARRTQTILPSTTPSTSTTETRMRIVLNLLNNNHRIRSLPVLAHIDSSSSSSPSSLTTTTPTLSSASSSASSSSFLSKQTNKYNNNWFSRKLFNSNSQLQMTTTSTSTTTTTGTTSGMMTDHNINDTIVNEKEQQEKDELIQLVIDSLCNDESNNKNNNNCNFGGIDYTNTYTNTDNNNNTNSNDTSTKYRVLFVLGGPGAGKGTQSELMVQNYPIEHYSVGQLLRDELVFVDTNEGADVDSERNIRRKLIQSTLDSGNIVPVEISLSLLYDTMKRSQQKQILLLIDGFPRNYNNLIGWCTTMKHVTTLLGVLVYVCPLQILEQRILQRSIVQPGRSDDNIVSLQKRFITFQQQTIPVTSLLRHAITTLELKSATTKEEEVTNTTDYNNTNNNTSTSTSTSTVRLSKYYEVIDIQGDQSIDTVWKTTQQILNKYVINDVVSTNVILLHAIETYNLNQYKLVTASTTNFTTTNNNENDIQLLMTLYQQEQILMNSLTAIPSQEQEQQQETSSSPHTQTTIKNATIYIISGKCIELQYDRYFAIDSSTTICVNEKRTWEHHGQSGWQLVQTIICKKVKK